VINNDSDKRHVRHEPGAALSCVTFNSTILGARYRCFHSLLTLALRLHTLSVHCGYSLDVMNEWHNNNDAHRPEASASFGLLVVAANLTKGIVDGGDIRSSVCAG
jgi:hypothetical protein